MPHEHLVGVITLCHWGVLLLPGGRLSHPLLLKDDLKIPFDFRLVTSNYDVIFNGLKKILIGFQRAMIAVINTVDAVLVGVAHCATFVGAGRVVDR